MSFWRIIGQHAPSEHNKEEARHADASVLPPSVPNPDKIPSGDNTREAASKVWACLRETGESTVSEICVKTGLSPDAAHRAIGLLVRQEKLHFEFRHRKERIRLR